MAVEAQFPNRPTLRTHYENQLKYFNAIKAQAESGLTSQAPPSRKRSRDSMPESIPLPLPATTNVGFQMTSPPCIVDIPASTSGRASSLLVKHLASHLYSHSVEIDTITRLHMERLRSDLQQACNKHNNLFLSTIEHEASKRLRQMEVELESAYRRNAELEEKIRQLNGEKDAWMNIARTNETIVGNLHTTIQQLLIQNANINDCEPNFPAEDVQSCCYEPESGDGLPEISSQRACRACGCGDVSVLVLPCRHLCLCKDCESRVDTCPVCLSAKNASLQVFMA